MTGETTNKLAALYVQVGSNMENYSIIKDKFMFKTEEKEIHLTGKLWEILEVLHQNKFKVVSKKALFKTIWGHDYNPSEHKHRIERAVSRLRSEIGQGFIFSYSGRGYSFGPIRKRDKLAQNEFVYIMSLGFNNLYKIGRGDPRQRLLSGKRFNPRIYLVAVAPAIDPIGTEAYLHRVYKKNKTQNEIFKLSQDNVDEIIDYMDSLYDL